MIVPPKPRRRLKNPRTERDCIQLRMFCVHAFPCNTKYKRFLVIQYQIKDGRAPKKAPNEGGSCKRETVRSTERIVNPFRQCLFFFFFFVSTKIQADEFKIPHLVQIPSTRMSAF